MPQIKETVRQKVKKRAIKEIKNSCRKKLPTFRASPERMTRVRRVKSVTKNKIMEKGGKVAKKEIKASLRIAVLNIKEEEQSAKTRVKEKMKGKAYQKAKREIKREVKDTIVSSKCCFFCRNHTTLFDEEMHETVLETPHENRQSASKHTRKSRYPNKK